MEPGGVMAWDYTDFSVVDHRLQLYCHLSLFREGETLLLLAKGEMRLRSLPAQLWPGLILITNKRIHLLRILKAETESPGEWLETRASASISRLNRLVGLVGGQGLGLELSAPSPQYVQPSFYRLPMSGAGYQSPGDSTDCYYVILRDRDRTTRLTEQLVDKLQQAVRSAPIPVTWLTKEEENVLLAQVQRVCPNTDLSISLFQLALLHYKENIKVSVIVTPSHIFLARDFFSWLFQSSEKELEILQMTAIEDIVGLSIYERWPSRLHLKTKSANWRLSLTTEAGVLELVGALRGPWQAKTGLTLEEATRFHLLSSDKVVVMQSLLSDESMTPSTFSLGQWIKVTSQRS